MRVTHRGGCLFVEKGRGRELCLFAPFLRLSLPVIGFSPVI
jgi:hypothetical protein